MYLYTTTKRCTVSEIAHLVGRSIRQLCSANGIPAHALIEKETTLLIPSPQGCCRRDASPLIITCTVPERRCPRALFRYDSGVSLILHRGGVLTRNGGISAIPRLPIRRQNVPTLLAPQCTFPVLPAERVLPLLKQQGYLGISLPYLLRGECYRLFRESCQRHDMTFALSADGSALLTHPEMFTAPCDILYVTPPMPSHAEDFISEMTLLTSPATRRKIMLVFRKGDCTVTYKKGVRNGRLTDATPTHRDVRECHLAICRLIHDGYGGVRIPCGETSPSLYSMLNEMGNIIPASQRNGGHSLS